MLAFERGMISSGLLLTVRRRRESPPQFVCQRFRVSSPSKARPFHTNIQEEEEEESIEFRIHSIKKKKAVYFCHEVFLVE